MNHLSRNLFPSDVAVHCLPIGDNIHQIFSQEAELVIQHSRKRQWEFSSGRVCAHRAIQSCGKGHAPVLSNPQRLPVWPAGVIGSISHCKDIAIACATASPVFVGLGIDVENLGGPIVSAEQLLFTTNELEWLNSLSSRERRLFSYLIFSGKESLYKALYPIIKTFIDYVEFELKFDPTKETFCCLSQTAKIGKLTKDLYCKGRYSTNSSHVFTGVTLYRKSS